MHCFLIAGGVALKGEITVGGAKNAALPILSASLLTDSPTVVSNIPKISDIQHLLDCLTALGKKIEQHDTNTITLSSSVYESLVIPEEPARKIRGSILLLGPLIARHKKVILPRPGGCKIGGRSIDQHIMAIKAFGVDITESESHIECSRRGDRLQANTISFDLKTVTGTENAIMAAVLANGTSIIKNAATEPEIQDLINFLNTLGAKISWTCNDSLMIEGVEALNGCHNYSIVGDRIEAGTFLVAAAITGGSICVKGVSPVNLDSCLSVLETIGAKIRREKTAIYLDMPSDCERKPFSLITSPYPGFPTDLQSVFLSLSTTLNGKSTLVEEVFENRFILVDELRKMGASICLEGKSASVVVQPKLKGATVKAPDLRSGAALVCAALAAEGETRITAIENIERGYENILLKLRKLGARISMVQVDEPVLLSTNPHSFLPARRHKLRGGLDRLYSQVVQQSAATSRA
jgi:UDP-N-acetylglucosamine 1-carboxyvinyltransferase